MRPESRGQSSRRTPGAATRRLVFALAVPLAAFSVSGIGAVAASAQLIECTDQPLLATFDANDDGILSVVEIRQADPADVALQEYADELEAAGIVGVFYAGCDDLEDGGEAGPGGADDEDGGEPEVTEQAEGDVEDDRDNPNGDSAGEAASAGDELVVTTLPGVGHGLPHGLDASRSWASPALASIATAMLIVAMAATRPAATSVRTLPAIAT